MKNFKKIGVFDSGLGGLFIANAIRRRLPAYDYLYLGDTLNLPYGRRSDAQIYDLSERAMRFLFAKNCDLVVMACNTASAAALRKLQQEFLVAEFPEKRILGVIVPTLESAIAHGAKRIGLIGTERTVHSKIYEMELQKINPDVAFFARSTPLLVPLIEHHGEKYLDAVLADYLAPLMAERVQSLILGCTHYVALKKTIQKLWPDVHLIAQDDIIPEKLNDYLLRHSEMEVRLSKTSTLEIFATDANESFSANIRDMMSQDTPVRHAQY
jgi:glutamate racemase